MMSSDKVKMGENTHKDDKMFGTAEESSDIKTGNGDVDPVGESGSETMAPKNTHQPVPSIKTLADLIHVCRDRGLQIYHDKKNIPDSDRLKVLPAHLIDPKIHRSDGYDARRRGESVSSRRSRHLSRHKQSDLLESPSRMRRSHSRRTTQSYKSSSDWRMKSPTTSTLSHGHSEYSVTTDRSSGQQTLHNKESIDYPNVDGDIEAEKILRMRMRKRVRRHRETVTNLVDVIRMKQKELELVENKLKLIRNEEGHESNDKNQVEVGVDDKSEVPGDWNSGNIDSGIESDKIKSGTSSTSDLKGKDEGLNENVCANVNENDNDEKIDRQTNEGLNENVCGPKHDNDEKIGSQNNEGLNENVCAPKHDNDEKMGSQTNEGLNENVCAPRHDNDEKIDSQTNSEKNDHVSAESFDNVLENLNDKVNDTKDDIETNKSLEETAVNNLNEPNREVNNPNAHNEDTEIQEYVIQDGNTKLVLYRLKTSTALLENIENKNSYKNENKAVDHKEAETENKGSNDEKTISDSEPGSYNNDQLNDPPRRSDRLSQVENQTKTTDYRAREASDYTVTPSISNNRDYDSQGTLRTNNDINNSSSTNGNLLAHSLSVDEQRDLTQLQSTSKSEKTNSYHKNNVDENCDRNLDVSQKNTMTTRGNKLADKENGRSLNTVADEANIDSQSDLCDIKPKSNSGDFIRNNGESNDTGNIELDTMATQESYSQRHSVEGSDKVSTNYESNLAACNMEILNDKLENSEDVMNGKIGYPDTNDETLQGSLKSSDGKVSHKKAKRSLGNGFLVSEDDDDGNITGMKGDTTGVKNNEVGKVEHGMENEKQTDEKDVQGDKAKNHVVSKTRSQPSTSGRGSKTNARSFSSAAKQVLIATRIKQSFNEEKSRQANYVKEIGDTRKALRELYRKLRSGEDVEVNTKMDEELGKPREPEVVENGENVQEIADEKVTEEVKSTIKIEEDEIGSSEGQMPEDKVVSAVDEEEKVTHKAESEKSVPRKLELESNEDNSSQGTSKTKPYCVEKKVDNEWDTNHPLYDQIKCGFKSHYRILDTKKVNIALRGLRTETFDTSHVSDDNVYLQEAKRIYPQGFKSSEQKPKRTNDLDSNGIVKVRNILTKQSDPQTRFSPERLVREKSVYAGKDSQKSIGDKLIKTYKTRTLKIVPKSENTKDTSTPRKKIQPRFKPKKRSNMVDVEEDKLNKDRNTVEQYQQYLNNTANLPSVNGKHRKNNGNVTPVTSRNSKQISTEIPQAKFASYTDRDDNGEDDNTPNGLEDSDLETLVSREAMKDRLARRASERSVSSEQRPEDVPLSKAVEIVKSRQKFYNENGEIHTKQREHRVFKLFREIQIIRKGADNSDNSTITDYPVMDSSPFLMMDYDYPQSAVSTHRTNTDLQKFLCSSLDYNNMCLKSRSLYSYPRRRDKAWHELKQKLDHSVTFSHNLK